MHHLACLLFSIAFSWPLVAGQFSLPGSDGSGYPRIKLAGPLGQLISGQGLSLNSGFGQVLSNLISNAAGGGSSGSSGGGPLSQLATAASTNYINAIRTALPFGQMGQMGQSQGQQSSMFGQLGNPLASFLGGDSGSIGYGGSGQSSGYGESGHGFQSHYPSHYQGAGENAYFGGHGGYGHGAYGHGHPGQAQGMFAHPSYNSHMPAPVHHLDRKK